MSAPVHDSPAEPEQRQLVLDHQAILENAWVGICFTRERRFQRLNPRFAQMHGYAPEELLGQPTPMIFPSSAHYEALGRVAAPVLASGESFQTEMETRRKDGTLFWSRVTAKAVDRGDPSCGTIWIVEDITASREANARLTQALIEQRAIMNNAPVGIAFTRGRAVVQCNVRFAEMFAFEAGVATGQSLHRFFPSVDDYRRFSRRARQRLTLGEAIDAELELVRADGRRLWGRVTGTLLSAGSPADGTIWIVDDITLRRRAEAELLATTTLQRAILEGASHMIISTRVDGTVQMFNPAAERCLGYGAGEVVGHATLESFLAPGELLERARELAAEFGRPVSGSESLFLWAREGFADEREWHLVRRDGSRFPVQLSVTALKTADDGAITGFLAIGSDITDRRRTEDMLLRARSELEQRVQVRTQELLATNEALQTEIRERRQIEERIRHIAHHDALTGLPNRFMLQERLAHALDHAEHQQRQIIVMFIDLDRFKNINDSLGHGVGDELLHEVGRRLRSCIRDEDFIARIGGDEFVVVLSDVKSATAAQTIADKLLRAMAEPFRVEPHELAITASIGLCVYPRDGETVDALMRNADTAMYRAKSLGRNNVQRFDSAMTLAAAHSFQLESSLRRALERGELELHFQPAVHALDGQLLGAEALLRWNHPERGPLGPEEFLTVAEESGLIVPIGEWALAEACRHAAEWRREGLALPVAVNLSGRQFWQRNLIHAVTGALAESGLPAEALELEITEGTVMHQVEQAMTMLGELSEIGVKLAIDDFGTGYSSLSYLKRFPVDKLKVDRTFVRDIDRDPDDAAIVSAIIALANSMQLTPVAEGVESASQRDLLIERGCPAMQGYLFCPPLAGPEFIDYLRTRAGLADPSLRVQAMRRAG